MKKRLIIILAFILKSFLIFAEVPAEEKEALIALYNATDGSNWIFNGLWLSSQPVTNWFGVNVENISGQDHVTKILLNGNNLVGSIPTEISNLTNLTRLDLGFNQFPENIPIAVCNLTKLEVLSLEVCQLSGNIPHEIGYLTNLIDLSLGGNQLSGSLPSEIENLINLSIFDIRNNQFSGNIPSELENLISLEGIALSNNEFIGDLNLSSLVNLHGLYIDNNNFSQLDIRNGNNINFNFFNITNNPNLVCVFVDDATWSEANWLDKDETAHYIETQTQCDSYIGITDNLINRNSIIFPNPCSGKLHIKTKKTFRIKKVLIYNLLGEQMMIFNDTNTLDISILSNGIYFIKSIDQTDKTDIFKIIKE